MAETTKGAKAPYATPDRDNKKNTDPAPTKPSTAPEKKTPKTVTPLDPVPTGKHVRFNNNNKDESPKSKRGLVSRRGGRLGQGGSPAPPPSTQNKDEAVLEFKTYRSPQRKKPDTDTIPSLCSASSESSNTNKKPSSISCNSKDASIDTSPLTQQSPPTALTPPKNDGDRRNVTFSPPTPHTEVIRMDTQKKTPTKSPPGGQFQSLPSLQEAKLSSPCGIFLSPTATATDPAPPVPSLKEKKAEEPDDKKQTTTKEEQKDDDDDKKQKARDQERERAVATPTDFALDFGKGLRNTGSFDASNVLAWLQSPTANGLFSPGGGLGSALNTPRAAGMPAAPRTPRTPTMSTSFFFSDVASLPRNAEFTSPKASSKKGGPQGVYSSMICISPLASSKRKSQPQTPMNYNDVFASPRVAPEQGRPGNLPFLGDSPGNKAARRKNSNLDADMAERDLMEDEDLSVLLQLASNSNTPKGARGGGTHVFRSPRGRQKAAGYPPRPEAAGYDGNAPPGSNLPGLQLPVIGGRGDTSAKLARKPNEQDKNGSEDFKPPQLAIRSSSSSAGSKEILLGSEKKPATTKAKGGKGKSNAKASEKTKSKAGKRKGSNTRAGRPSAYSMPPYPHPGAEVGYYPLPGSIPPMPPGGSMRVVVGGPPPVPGGRSKGSGTGSSPPRRREGPYRMGDASYPRHPGAPLYPHHGVYPQHPHIGVPPHYPGHYPPPPPPPRHSSHLPIYSSSQRSSSSRASTGGGESIKKTKATKPTKSAAKRPAPSPPQKSSSPTKKPRKSPTKRKRTKVATPAPADRHKTAAAINAVNAASGKKNDKAAALAAAILRGVTMRPSGKWQAQLYYAGKSRYIGVFDTREKAALAYEIAREKLKSEKSSGDSSSQSLKATEAAVNAARKAAFEGVNEKDPRLASKK